MRRLAPIALLAAAACSGGGGGGTPQLAVTLSTSSIALVEGTAGVPVTATVDRDGYDGAITVFLVTPPAGVGAPPIVLEAPETEAQLDITAVESSHGEFALTIGARPEDEEILLAAASLTASIRGSPGAPDKTYGSLGTAEHEIATIAITAAAAYLDGGLVLVGKIGSGSAPDVAVVKLTPDGALDTTFDGDGLYSTDIAASIFETASGVVVQPDGRIVVAASSGAREACVLRLEPDGARDATFGTNGLTCPDFFGGIEENVEVAVLSDEKILVASRATRGIGGIDYGVLRLTSTGALDGTYGSAGKTFADLGATETLFGWDVAADGTAALVGELTSDAAIARFTAAGAQDVAFSGDGELVLDLYQQGLDRLHDAALLADGSVIAIGRRENDLALVKTLASGALDTSFADGGILIEDYFVTNQTGTSIEPLADGTFVVAVTLAFNQPALLGRRLADGSPDPTFGDEGWSVGSVAGGAGDVVVLADGKLVLAGSNGAAPVTVYATRFWAD